MTELIKNILYSIIIALLYNIGGNHELNLKNEKRTNYIKLCEKEIERTSNNLNEKKMRE